MKAQINRFSIACLQVFTFHTYQSPHHVSDYFQEAKIFFTYHTCYLVACEMGTNKCIN